MKNIIIALSISFLLLFGAIYLPSKNILPTNNSNVSIIDGVQTIRIEAKGGYSPKKTVAKAGIPTKLVISTNGTFDCSAAVVIPSLGVRKNLPMSGEETFDIGIKQIGETLSGLCSMGMYGFEVKFE